MRRSRLMKRLVIVLFTGLVIAGGGVWLQYWLNKQLPDRLRTAAPALIVDFSSVTLSIWRSSVDISNLTISPATINDSIHNNIRFASVQLRGIDRWQLFRHKRLHVRNLTLTGGTLSLSKSFLDQRDTFLAALKTRPANPLSSLHIGKVSCDSIRLDYFEKDIKRFSALAKLQASHLQLDSTRSSSQLPVQSYTLDITQARYQAALYTYIVNGLHAVGDSLNIDLTLNAFTSVPRFSKKVFSLKLGHQADRIESTLSGITIQHIDWSSLQKKNLFARSLSIDRIQFEAYRDRRVPRLAERQPMPAILLKNLPFKISIGKLIVNRAEIGYEEQPKDGGPTGKLIVTKGRLRVNNLINFPMRGRSDSVVIRASGSLMGSGTVAATIVLPLSSPSYHISGAIEKLELVKLNDAAEHLGMMHIASGTLDSLGFDFRFDDVQSTGKIVGIYHQLVIQPMKKAKGEKKIAGLKSFMLRRLIIPLNKGKKIPERRRTGAIAYRRDPTRKLSFYMLNALLTGIKASFKLGFLLPK